MYRGAAYADSLQYHHCIGEPFRNYLGSFVLEVYALVTVKFWKIINALPRLVEVCPGTEDC